jgi:hypothetical protein
LLQFVPPLASLVAVARALAISLLLSLSGGAWCVWARLLAPWLAIWLVARARGPLWGRLTLLELTLECRKKTNNKKSSERGCSVLCALWSVALPLQQPTACRLASGK